MSAGMMPRSRKVARSDGVEVPELACRIVWSEESRAAAGVSQQSVSCSFSVAMRRRLRCRASIFPPAFLVATGAALAAAELRRQGLHVPIQTS
jgi:hypothetical protein